MKKKQKLKHEHKTLQLYGIYAQDMFNVAECMISYENKGQGIMMQL